MYYVSFDVVVGNKRYLILSYLILSYLILSYLILSYLSLKYGRKQLIMVIIFKKVNRTYINNYLPMCMLSNVYKLFTKIITTSLEKKLDATKRKNRI